eukprot:370252-Prorocentrum_minimum.AAC.4
METKRARTSNDSRCFSSTKKKVMHTATTRGSTRWGRRASEAGWKYASKLRELPLLADFFMFAPFHSLPQPLAFLPPHKPCYPGCMSIMQSSGANTTRIKSKIGMQLYFKLLLNYLVGT